MARPGRAFLAAATALLLALSAPAAATDAAPSLLMMAAGSLPATANFAGLSRSTPAACDAGGSSDDHHDVPLRTYILTASRFNLRRAAASDGGSTHELRLPLDALPPFVPFVLNAAASGKGLRQGLIDPTRFLHDWAATMRAAARLLPGRHAMPGERFEFAHVAHNENHRCLCWLSTSRSRSHSQLQCPHSPAAAAPPERSKCSNADGAIYPAPPACRRCHRGAMLRWRQQHR